MSTFKKEHNFKMAFPKHCALVVLLFVLFDNSNAASICGDWLQFKDDKCYTIVDNTLRTYDEAIKSCETLDTYSYLPLIRSKEEQDFLANYLFKTLKKVESVWIGSKFSVGDNKYKWLDNSALVYTNWDPKAPKNKSNYCLQMEAEDSLVGKWIDEPCEKKNLVVCERLPTWTLENLQKTLLNTKRKLESDVELLQKQLNEVKYSSIPIGFLYTQLPSSKQPSEIWPSMTWTDVSSMYAGVFFRVAGGDAAAFGQIQADNSPRLLSSDTIEKETVKHATFEPGKCSQINAAGASGPWYGVQFCLSAGEVRPRNMAVHIWKRTG